MQLCAFIPLYNFKMIPYLYDAFKPFLVSHLVLSNEPFVLLDMKDDYFNINYDYYWLSVAKLGQALFMICIGFCLILVSNVVVFVGAKAFRKNSRHSVCLSLMPCSVQVQHVN